MPFVSTAAFLYSSNCSSSVGSAFLLRKRNSVLKSPTPSAPALTALAASSAPPILAASITFFPSAVSVLLLINVFNSSICSSYFFFFFSYIESVRCVGLMKTSPYAPSIIIESPLFTLLSIPFTLSTAGISSALARIEACAVSPPFSAIIPATCAVSIEAVIDGLISSATMTVLSGRLVRSNAFVPCNICIILSFIS